MMNHAIRFACFALISATFITEGFGLTCLNCRGIVQPRHCKYVTECGPFESCASERVETEHGEGVYYLGCKPATACQNSTGTHCAECCNTDLCNAHSCGERDYPKQRGPICYNCHDYPAERFCHDISFCNEEEVCSLVSTKEFGEVIATRSCTLKVTCASGMQGPVVGRRSLEMVGSDDRGTCDVCCQSDLCNANCTGHSGAVYAACSSNPCTNGSTCLNTGVGYTCLCPHGVTGKHCEIVYAACSSNPCTNGSTCLNTGDGYTCICLHGVTGKHCEIAYDSCSSSPCNNGTCSDHGVGYRCLCPPGITGAQCDQVKFRDCQEILVNGFSRGSGVYTVYLRNMSLDLEVYCDMETDRGGWTVFQKRFDGHVDFYRNFSEYEFGFGNVSSEFWLGLRYIQEMTQNHPDLRIDLVSSTSHHGYDSYSDFYLMNGPGYRLQLSETHRNSSFSGRSNIYYNHGYPFSTYDKDRSGRCAITDHGGWWYHTCTYANLNGEYITPGTSHTSSGTSEAGVIYDDFDDRRSLKNTTMMFRKR